jgi:hypothetical protein
MQDRKENNSVITHLQRLALILMLKYTTSLNSDKILGDRVVRRKNRS